MKIVYLLIYLIIGSIQSTALCSTLCIIIHGTWAKNKGLDHEGWYKPGGDFFEALHQSPYSQQVTLKSFKWSGRNNNYSRMHAAYELKDHIQSYGPNTEIIIIAHSHGANVAILTSHLLASDINNRHRIKRLYTLGVPVSLTMYLPNMDVIEYLYQLFSFKDVVQPVLGLFQRQFPPHERIANLRVFIDGKEPTHTGLHDPIVGSWILCIHEELDKQSYAIADPFQFSVPGIIHFYNDHAPLYSVDAQRNNCLQHDQLVQSILKQTILTRH